MKTAVRDMWGLEYEVDELQSKFSESIGTVDLDNIDVDFIEDMMLKSKPLQSVLNDIRNRQMKKLEDIKTTYGDAIKDLEVLIVARPPKGSGEAEPGEPDAPAAAAEDAAPVEPAVPTEPPQEAPVPAPVETAA